MKTLTLALVGFNVAVLIAGCGGATDTRFFESNVDSAEAGAGGGTTDDGGGTTDASDPDGGSGTSDGGSGCRLTVPSDCKADEFCRVTACATSGGTCTKKPVLTTPPPTATPICGCDGITYWDENVAASIGVNKKADGRCTTGEKTCNGQGKCPSGSFCNLEVSVCGVGGGQDGLCWGLPSSCPSSSAAGVVTARTCNGGGGVTCGTTYCQAVRSERSFSTAGCP